MEKKQFRYFDFVMAAFVCVILCADLIGVSKVTQVGHFRYGAGTLFFPISYLFGDILTEVYGYARARRVVWAGFAALIFASLMSWVILALPPADGWPHQAAFETVYGGTPRIVAGSLLAFFCGEFCNSFVLAKMKVRMRGRWLWLRMLSSTAVGEAVDCAIFYPIAFYGIWNQDLLLTVMLSNYALKVLWEFLATPLTYVVVNKLKRAEGVDHYDTHTNFSPFTLKT